MSPSFYPLQQLCPIQSKRSINVCWISGDSYKIIVYMIVQYFSHAFQHSKCLPAILDSLSTYAARFIRDHFILAFCYVVHFQGTVGMISSMGHLDPSTVTFEHIITNSRLAIWPKEDRTIDGSIDSYSLLPTNHCYSFLKQSLTLGLRMALNSWSSSYSLRAGFESVPQCIFSLTDSPVHWLGLFNVAGLPGMGGRKISPGTRPDIM